MGANGSEPEPSAIGLLRDGFTRVSEGIEALLEAAEPRMLRFRASSSANPVAWLIWHLSRVQDDHFTFLARALDPESVTEQRWIADDWVSRFNLPYRRLDTGFGHSSEQVADFGMYDGAYLRGYHLDVHRQCLEILGTLRESDLDVVVDRRWDPPVTAAARLVSILGETTAHLAQAEFVRGIFLDVERTRRPGA
ncbi:mycothiol transferase [Paeniglutamicibacter psychrophenolicus]|uniref:DinB-like domain-containing protein n=1 Tax=Paeniglutamicibacter psychrophenolicus TaxID=257454 RepID=A0ABS4WD06_9MICC|nr:hypothetical protein [Paeniglutamicibacter psychrophenolicus]